MANKTYGSVSGQSERITDLYGGDPIQNESVRITRLYGPAPTIVLDNITGSINPESIGNITAFDPAPLKNVINGISELRGYFIRDGIDYSNITRLNVYASEYQGNMYWEAYLELTIEGEDQYFFLSDTDDPYTLAELGLTGNITAEGVDYIDLTCTNGNGYASKLIYQGFGHYDYS